MHITIETNDQQPQPIDVMISRKLLYDAAVVFRTLGCKTMNFVGSKFGLRVMSEGFDGVNANPCPKVATVIMTEDPESTERGVYYGNALVSEVVKYVRNFDAEFIPLRPLPLSQGRQDCPDDFEWIGKKAEDHVRWVNPDMAKAISIASHSGFDPGDQRKFPIAVWGKDGWFQTAAIDGTRFHLVKTQEDWDLDQAILGHRNIGKYTITHIGLETHTYSYTTDYKQEVHEKTQNVTAVRFHHNNHQYMYRCLNEGAPDFNTLEPMMAGLEGYGLVHLAREGDSSIKDWIKVLRKFSKRSIMRVEFMNYPELREDDELNKFMFLFVPKDQHGEEVFEVLRVQHQTYVLEAVEGFRSALSFNPVSLRKGFEAMQELEEITMQYRTDGFEHCNLALFGRQEAHVGSSEPGACRSYFHSYMQRPQMIMIGTEEFYEAKRKWGLRIK